MTSESSSAVLDLNNVDTEDTEPPSITEDTKDVVPLIMEHGYDIAVKVDSPMKQLSTLETFVTYRVRCVCARWPTPPYVRRRYNHFKLLHKRLSQSHPLIAAPPLPPLHSARQQLDRYSPSFVGIRTLALHAFLDRVAKHPILTYSDDFRIFLTTPDEELDKVFKSDSSALNLWGLGSAFYGSGETKPTNGARVKDPEFTSAADYLQSLQQKLTTLCTLTTKLYKGTAAISNEMMGMKRACDLWSCQERASVSRASGACACGSNAAHRATLMAARAPPMHRAMLPMLAAYAGAHVDKINSRDAVHASYVSGASTTNEVHNRLEQASEALRSELADWLPKTHTDVKNLLLDLATRQVNLQTQILMGWEHALKLSTDATVDEMFKTVSKSAVQNLSPSKCRSPNETERDFDDFEDVSNDSDSRDAFVSDDGNFNAEFDIKDPEKAELTNTAIAATIMSESADTNDIDNDIAKSELADNKMSDNILKSDDIEPDTVKTKLDTFRIAINTAKSELADAEMADNLTKSNSLVSDINSTSKLEEFSNADKSADNSNFTVKNVQDLTKENSKTCPNVEIAGSDGQFDSAVKLDSSVDIDNLTVPNDVTEIGSNLTKSTEFLKDILDDKAVTEDNTKVVLENDFTDPLTEFSEVDLS